jgi:hypothetical protein
MIIYGIYPDPDTAQLAVNVLTQHSAGLGIAKKQIVVVSAEPFDGYDFFDEHAHTYLFGFAAFGGLMGGLFGYWLTSLTQKAYPLGTGGMPIVPPWTNSIVIYELIMLGAIIGTIATLLVSARLPQLKVALSDPQIWTGKILVGVTDAVPSSRSSLEKHFFESGALEVKEHSPDARK